MAFLFLGGSDQGGSLYSTVALEGNVIVSASAFPRTSWIDKLLVEPAEPKLRTLLRSKGVRRWAASKVCEETLSGLLLPLVTAYICLSRFRNRKRRLICIKGPQRDTNGRGKFEVTVTSSLSSTPPTPHGARATSAYQ